MSYDYLYFLSREYFNPTTNDEDGNGIAGKEKGQYTMEEMARLVELCKTQHFAHHASDSDETVCCQICGIVRMRKRIIKDEEESFVEDGLDPRMFLEKLRNELKAKVIQQPQEEEKNIREKMLSDKMMEMELRTENEMPKQIKTFAAKNHIGTEIRGKVEVQHESKFKRTDQKITGNNIGILRNKNMEAYDKKNIKKAQNQLEMSCRERMKEYDKICKLNIPNMTACNPALDRKTRNTMMKLGIWYPRQKEHIVNPRAPLSSNQEIQSKSVFVNHRKFEKNIKEEMQNHPETSRTARMKAYDTLRRQKNPTVIASNPAQGQKTPCKFIEGNLVTPQKDRAINYRVPVSTCHKNQSNGVQLKRGQFENKIKKGNQLEMSCRERMKEYDKIRKLNSPNMIALNPALDKNTRHKLIKLGIWYPRQKVRTVNPRVPLSSNQEIQSKSVLLNHHKFEKTIKEEMQNHPETSRTARMKAYDTLRRQKNPTVIARNPAQGQKTRGKLIEGNLVTSQKNRAINCRVPISSCHKNQTNGVQLKGGQFENKIKKGAQNVMQRNRTKTFLYAFTKAISSLMVEFKDVSKLMPSDTVTLLPSSLKDKHQKNVPNVFFIHAVEGFVSSLNTLASLLPYKVYGIECTEKAPLDSITSLAAFYIQNIKNVQSKGPYYLIGYSFGASVAYELGVQLEKMGEKAVLLLLDGSPEFVSQHTGIYKAQQPDGMDADIYRMGRAYTHFISLFKDIKIQEVEKELMSSKSIQEMSEKLTNILKDSTPYSGNELSAAAKSFFMKLTAADKFKPESVYGGDVILIKAQDNFLPISEDYGLKSICKKPIKIYSVKGNHREILIGDSATELSNIIQKTLNSV